MEDINVLEYDPVMAQAAIEVPDYSHNRFIVMENNESLLRPIGKKDFLDNKIYITTKLEHHKFWVVANKSVFKSASSESDLANIENIVGIGCFIHESGSNKYFIFSIDGVLFYGPAIFPNGGSYVNLCNMKVVHPGLLPENDYYVLKNYLTDINKVEYWDFKKHA
jgi:hypothetical protein